MTPEEQVEIGEGGAMKFTANGNTFVPEMTGRGLSFSVTDGGELVMERDGEPPVTLSREEAVALLGFNPAEHVTLPVRLNHYVQLVEAKEGGTMAPEEQTEMERRRLDRENSGPWLPGGAAPKTTGLPEPYASFTDLDLLRRVAHEADAAKQLLRKAGFGVTGTGLLETVKEAMEELKTQSGSKS